MTDEHGELGSVGKQLDRIETKTEKSISTAAAAQQEAGQAYAEARATNARIERVEDRLGRVERDLYPPDEDWRRPGNPGVIQRLDRHEERLSKQEKTTSDVRGLMQSKRLIFASALSIVGVQLTMLLIVLQAL